MSKQKTIKLTPARQWKYYNVKTGLLDEPFEMLNEIDLNPSKLFQDLTFISIYLFEQVTRNNDTRVTDEMRECINVMLHFLKERCDFAPALKSMNKNGFAEESVTFLLCIDDDAHGLFQELSFINSYLLLKSPDDFEIGITKDSINCLNILMRYLKERCDFCDELQSFKVSNSIQKAS